MRFFGNPFVGRSPSLGVVDLHTLGDGPSMAPLDAQLVSPPFTGELSSEDSSLAMDDRAAASFDIDLDIAAL